MIRSACTFQGKLAQEGVLIIVETKTDENEGFKVDSYSEFDIDYLLHSDKIGKIIVFWKQAIVG
jgi:hypothetical protein